MEVFVKELQAIAGELRQQANAFAADRRWSGMPVYHSGVFS